MPVVEVSKADLERLTGLRYGEISRLFEFLKAEVEGEGGDLLRLEVTHDRPDHFSAEGLARTLRGLAEVEVGLPRAAFEGPTVELRVERIEERPHIAMAVVRDVELDDEAIRQLIQLQEKLHETYGRRRRKVAIGYYDLDMVRPPIYYRRVSRDDVYTPLGHGEMPVWRMCRETEQGVKYCGLVDRERPPALVDSAGQIMVVVPVLGSEFCKVTPRTRNVLIDVTGTDARAVEKALAVLTYSVLERSRTRRAEVARVEGRDPRPPAPRALEVDAAAVSGYLGVEVAEGELARLLLKARYGYDGKAALVPPYRINVMSWVDVAEDVAIAMGYNSLPREAPLVPSHGSPHLAEVASREARRALLAMGFWEVAHYVLTRAEGQAAFCRAAAVRNPISELYTAVRCSILPQLLEAAASLRRREVRIFEVGDVVRGGRTERVAAFLLSREGATLTDGLSTVRALCSHLGTRCRFSEASEAWALPGRLARVEGLEGLVGEVSPQLLSELGLYMPTVVGEVKLI